MTAPAFFLEPADPFVAVRVMNRMRTAGFALSLEAGALAVIPATRLSDAQRASIRTHKLALVALLTDAETLHTALVCASAAGLGWWRQGTPEDWTVDRLLAAGEVLYGDGRMVNYMERRYAVGLKP